MRRPTILLFAAVLLAACGPLESNSADPTAVRTPRLAATAAVDRAGSTATTEVPSGEATPGFTPDFVATQTAEVAGTVPAGPSPYAEVTLTPAPTSAVTFGPNEPIGTPPLPTPTPLPLPPVGSLTPLTFTPGPDLTIGDLEARGDGDPARGVFTGARMSIPKIGVDAAVSIAVVGSDGDMPDPPTLADVLWYDFSGWPGLGGMPGGGNAVFAGDVAEPGVGAGVFVRLYELVPGDVIQLRLTTGQTLAYRVEFNKLADTASADWTGIVTATADDSMTMITGAGTLAQRRILWARRVDD